MKKRKFIFIVLIFVYFSLSLSLAFAQDKSLFNRMRDIIRAHMDRVAQERAQNEQKGFIDKIREMFSRRDSLDDEDAQAKGEEKIRDKIQEMVRTKVAPAKDMAAQAQVRRIIVALETYYSQEGRYPSSGSDILGGRYDNKVKQGHRFSIDTSDQGYKITAEPVECGVTGTKTIIADSDYQDLMIEDCRGPGISTQAESKETKSIVDKVRQMMENPMAAAHDTSALSEVRKIITAMEIFSTEVGRYPNSPFELSGEGYGYLQEPYHNRVKGGHKFYIQTSAQRYKITATPEHCGVSGIKIITATSPEGMYDEPKVSQRDCESFLGSN